MWQSPRWGIQGGPLLQAGRAEVRPGEGSCTRRLVQYRAEPSDQPIGEAGTSQPSSGRDPRPRALAPRNKEK